MLLLSPLVGSFLSVLLLFPAFLLPVGWSRFSAASYSALVGLAAFSFLPTASAHLRASSWSVLARLAAFALLPFELLLPAPYFARAAVLLFPRM